MRKFLLPWAVLLLLALAVPAHSQVRGIVGGSPNVSLATGTLPISHGGTGVTNNATAYTVFGNNTASSAAPAFTAAPSISGALSTIQAIGAVSTDGIVLQNPTAAAVNAQKTSPRIKFGGSGWKTASTAAAQPVEFINELTPIQGSAAPSGVLGWYYQINSGGYNPVLALYTDGRLVGGPFVGSLTGNADTSTALAANGANCSAGSYPLGVDASGAVEGCTALSGQAARTFFEASNTATPTVAQIGFDHIASCTGTITGYAINVDAGTMTVKFWKKAAGTAIATSGDSISTSGVAISSGTSTGIVTSLGDFTTLAVTAGDHLDAEVTVVSGVTKASIQLFGTCN